jgi:hypothetical protein
MADSSGAPQQFTYGWDFSQQQEIHDLCKNRYALVHSKTRFNKLNSG